MAKRETTEQAVHRMAKAHPNVTLGVACKGTALESTTFEVNDKAFLFLRKTPAGYEARMKVAGTWIKHELVDGKLPAKLETQIAASYAAMAPKPKRARE